MNIDKNDIILDYGGGRGELSCLFKKEGFDITHCDISFKMIQEAKKKGVKSYLCSKIEGCFSIILFHNAFFYIHPKKQEENLKKLYDLLNDDGILYITDTPDFDKREYAFKKYNIFIRKLFVTFTKLIPVYQPYLGSFFINDKDLKNIAYKVGFKKVEKIDSWNCL